MKIEDNVEIPEETKKPKSRARRQATSKKAKAPNPAASLIAALKFISVAQKKAGPTNLQFSHITNKWVAASDGILTVAHPIEEDLEACPHTLQFIDALSKVGEDLSIIQLTANSLAISSGAFRGLVPCVAFEDVPITAPDPSCATLDDRLKTALLAVAGLANESAPSAAYAAVLLQAGSAVATNGAALLEAWHGIDLPPGLMLPKAAALAVAKAQPSLVGFGFSESSATFYFENGAFIKTQLFAERFPNYHPVFEVENFNPWPIPDEFFKAVRAVESFSQNGHIFFEDSAVLSKSYKEEATSYKVEGVPDGMGFSSKLLLAVEHAMKNVHFDKAANKVVFLGENIRGALMALDTSKNTSYNQQSGEDLSDDIPF